jgi:hypothetical protein
MAQSGFTPISLYFTTTAAAVPTAGNLVNGELAINITDGKLYYKNNSGVVTLLAQSGAGVAGGSNTQVQFNSSGVLAGSANMTFNGTILTATGFAGPLNGTVGATTANTGAFTTLSATGVATFSAGSVSAPAITTTGDTNTGIYFPAADTIAFTEGGAESMRIDSAGNVGIGISSPTSKLHVAGGRTDLTANNETYSLGVRYGTGVGIYYIGASNSATPDLIFSQTGGSERVRITNAGELGVGPASNNRLALTYDGGSGVATVGPNSTGGSTLLTFGTSLAGTYGERVRIAPDGNVGIGTTTTTSAQLTIAGTSSVSALKVPNIEEVATISATAATGTINYDITTQSVLYYTSNASANWTVNFRGSSGTSLNTLMQTGESMSCTFLVTQGATAYYNSAVQIDGTTSGVTTEWQGGTAPTTGNASSVDSYTYVIIKTGSATYLVLATQTRFA